MPPGSKAPELGRARRTGGVWPRIAVVLTGVTFLFPITYLSWGTLSLGGDFWGALTSSTTLGPLSRSLLLAATVAATCAVVGTSLAIAVARTDLPGRGVLRVALALPLAIPSFVGATALLAAFGPGALVPAIPRFDGFWGSLVVLALLSYPYVYLPVLGRLAGTGPALEEVARQLGSSPPRTMMRVVLPQLRASIATGTMLVFLYALSDFGAVSLLRYDTITRAIFSARLFDRPTSLTLGLVLALLALAVAVAERFARHKREVASISVSGQAVYSLGRFRVPAVAGVVALIGGALAAPAVVFATWVVRGSATVGFGFTGLGDGLGFLVGPTIGSVVVAVIAGFVATVILLPLAYATARRHNRLAGGVSAVVVSVFALPGLVVALAVVFWAVQAPQFMAGLYQSFPLLVLVYVLHFGAQSLRSSQAAISAIPSRYDDAARTLGVGSRRRFLEIELPLLAPGLLAGGGLVMLSTLKELPATLLLSPIGFQTLATRIWGAAQDGFYAEVGVTSLLLIAVSALLTWLLVLRPEFSRRTGDHPPPPRRLTPPAGT